MAKVVVSFGISAPLPKIGVDCWIAHFGPFKTHALACEWLDQIWSSLGTLRGLAYSVNVLADPYDYGEAVTTLISALVPSREEEQG